MSTPFSSSCANHAGRSASALCLTCRRSLCQECATTWDGINYCANCLRGRRKETAHSKAIGGWISLGVASGLLFYLLGAIMVWLGALITGLF